MGGSLDFGGAEAPPFQSRGEKSRPNASPRGESFPSGLANMLKRLPLLIVTLHAIFTWSFTAVLAAQEAVPAPSSEQILSYDSDITVNRDSTLLLRETIKVSTVGPQKHVELHRDVPTRYHDRFGNPYTIHLEVISLQCDARPAEFRLRKYPNGLSIYLGGGSELVSAEHSYELAYTVDRGLGFFPEYDELYWNVTGDWWTLPIAQATATVHLPTGIAPQAILLDAYTGRPNSAGTNYVASADAQGNATFRTTRVLGPYEGLTLVVRWPKGFVHPPTEEQEHQYFREDNQALLIGLLGLMVILIYYSAAWFLAGADSARGEVVPRSDPPRGFSPAALRYLWRGVFDQKTMVANLVDSAVKKHMAILEDASGAYILGRLKSSPPPTGVRPGSSEGPAQKITPDEKLVLHKLFAAGDTIALIPAHQAIVGGAIEALHYRLRWGLQRAYFMTNARYLIPGLLISLATVARCGFAIQGGQGLLVLFLTIVLLPWSLGCLTAAVLAVALWRCALSDPHHPATARKQALITSAICLAFFIVEAAGLGVMAWAASPEVGVALIILVAINYAFHMLLKAPTRSGRALLDQIEGFRQFMTTTERGRRDARTPLRTTPLLFERLLPFAMALNVEKVWCEKFAAALAQTAHGGTRNYSPAWYSGPGWDPITASTFATALGNSFSSAISSATRAPGAGSRRTGSPPGGGGGG